MRYTDRTVTDDEVLQRIIELIREKGLRQQDVTNYLGIKNNAFTRWKYDNGKSYIKYLDDIANFLGVTRQYLLEGVNKSGFDEILSPEEKAIIKGYRKLNMGDRKCIANMIILYSNTMQ